MASQKTITRQKLYQDVWDKPASTLSSEYGISGSMIARICTKLNVPRPPRGYWAKKSNGRKTIQRPKLPKATEDHLHEWHTDRRDFLTTQKPQDKTSFNDNPKIPDKEHRMIKATRSALRGQKQGSGDLICPRRRWKHVSVNVTEDQMERALAILNSLLYLCEEHGINVYSPVQVNPSATHSYTDDYTLGKVRLRWEAEELSLSIRETKTRFTKKSEYTWDNYSYSPSGILEITVGNLKKRDAKLTKLEARIPELAQSALEQMQSSKIERLKREEEKKRVAFIAEYNDARNSQKRCEGKIHNLLLDRSANYKYVTELREFIHICEQQVERLQFDGSSVSQDKLLRIRWMKTRLEMIDPFSDTKRPWNEIPLFVAKGLEPERYYW